MLWHSFAVFLSLYSLSHALAVCIQSPRTISIPNFTVKQLGNAESNFRNVTIERDGGGGGLVNGKHFVLFSDTTTKGNMTGGFVSNTITQLDPNDPQTLTDFGTNNIPSLAIPFEKNETEYCQTTGCYRVVIWPSGNIVSLKDGTGLTVSGVAVIPDRNNVTGNELYNTMVTINASDTTPKLTRKVPQLFFASEIQWGSFGLLMNPLDGKLNLFGKDQSGIKVAAVDPENYADRSKYTYWNGTAWNSSPPKLDSSDGNILSALFSSGDIFWSSHLNTFVVVYMNGWADSKFYLRYSLDGTLTGTWSDEQLILTTTPASSVYNYGGHAYPSVDPTGKTLLLSWTYNLTTIQMARVTFE